MPFNIILYCGPRDGHMLGSVSEGSQAHVSTVWLLLRARNAGLFLCCPHSYPELHGNAVSQSQTLWDHHIGGLRGSGLWFLSCMLPLHISLSFYEASADLLKVLIFPLWNSDPQLIIWKEKLHSHSYVSLWLRKTSVFAWGRRRLSWNQGELIPWKSL